MTDTAVGTVCCICHEPLDPASTFRLTVPDGNELPFCGWACIAATATMTAWQEEEGDDWDEDDPG